MTLCASMRRKWRVGAVSCIKEISTHTSQIAPNPSFAEWISFKKRTITDYRCITFDWGRMDGSILRHPIYLGSDWMVPPQTALLGSGCQIPQTAGASSWEENWVWGSVGVERAHTQPSAAAASRFLPFCRFLGGGTQDPTSPRLSSCLC